MIARACVTPACTILPLATTPVVIHCTICGMRRLATSCIATSVAVARWVTRSQLCPSRITMGRVCTTNWPTSVNSRVNTCRLALGKEVMFFDGPEDRLHLRQYRLDSPHCAGFELH